MRFQLFAVGAVLGLLPLSMRADTTYTYTGTPFTFSDIWTPSTGNQPVNPPGTLAAPYTSSDIVTGSFTLAGSTANLQTNQFFFSAASFSFTDGVQTISSANGDHFFGFFATDASGNLTDYTLKVTNASLPNDFIEIEDVAPGQSPASFGKYQITSTDVVDVGTNDLGTITAVSATPEPASLALMGTGMIGLMAEMRRRVRRG